MWEWKLVQCLQHILGYAVGLDKPANELSRSSVDPPKPLHPDPRYTSEDGTTSLKYAPGTSMNVNISGLGSFRDEQLTKSVARLDAGQALHVKH